MGGNRQPPAAGGGDLRHFQSAMTQMPLRIGLPDTARTAVQPTADQISPVVGQQWRNSPGNAIRDLRAGIASVVRGQGTGNLNGVVQALASRGY